MVDAPATVHILLGNLKQLADDHRYTVISGVDEQLLQQLTDRLSYLSASIEKVKDNERALRQKILDAVYEAEDVLEAYVTQAVAAKSKTWISKFFDGKVKLDGIARKVQQVWDESRGRFGDISQTESDLLEIVGDDEEQPEWHQARKAGEDEWKLINYLTPQSQSLDVLSIIDRSNLGKTTLARKVLRNPLIQYEFPTRISVDVSKLPPKHVFLNILKEFTTISEEIRSMSEHELAQKVAGYLLKGRFLLVVNDVLSAKEWDKVRVALPNSNHMGKVLITSIDKSVGLHANRDRDPHELRILKAKESWDLLRNEVFGKSKCPSELRRYGEVIASKCGGLPLAITVMGGILKKTTNTGSMRNSWRDVHKRVSKYPDDGAEGTVNRVISLSYDMLPFHLKACFLYLGIFPKDFDIPASKLVRLWIAEGFVQEKMSCAVEETEDSFLSVEKISCSVEETAESYLSNLVSRNLLRVDKRSVDGKVKTCRVHDAIWEFCKTKAGKDGENFLQEIVKSSDGTLTPPIQRDVTSRRLSIHSDILTFAASRPSGLRVRSIVCFANEATALPSEYISAIPSGFKLLRVLDTKPIKLPKLSSDMFDLLHLRFIHLSLGLSILPSPFSKLWNLQTLIIDTTHRSLLIKADIYKMTHLRHLKTNAMTVLPQPTKDVEGGGSIRTLSIMSTQSCTEKVIDNVRNLTSLTIRGRLLELLEDKTLASEASFDNLVKLGSLERLKLVNDVFPSSYSEGRLTRLPSPDKFPPNLKILTLSETFLEWSQMEVLGSLEKLRVLKLKEKAFMGRCWETIGGGFRRLEVLLIGRTDLVNWKASPLHFPTLERLELRYCDELEEIPMGLADIPSLGVLELSHCRRAAAESAGKIKEAKSRGDPSGEFVLSIFPPLITG